MRTADRMSSCLALGLVLLPAISDAEGSPTSIIVTVEAGRYDRSDTPLQLSIQSGSATSEALESLRSNAGEGGALTLLEIGEGVDPASIAAQLDLRDDGPRLTFVMPGATAAGTTRRFRIDPAGGRPGRSPWAFDESAEGHLELSHGGSAVFRYNTRPVLDPDHLENDQPRDAYIHPAFAPSGAVVTGDYSRESHPHHRGFFLAYTKTEVDGLHPDFWNIQGGSGSIVFDRLGDAVAGPVTARFDASHRWRAGLGDGGWREVLLERWDVEAIDVPGAPYWLIDLTSTQRATGPPLVLPPYRYGGMAYRGPDSFFPEGVLDVLTSEGLGRVEGDQRPARWVDMTGPVGDGRYAGAAILDHPGNLHHPTPARIHPTTLPFFCFVPSHDRAVTIGPDAPTVFRYRILIHDGHPDAGLDERVWRDFAEPPTATLRAAP